jgi:hypothetical protein
MTGVVSWSLRLALALTATSLPAQEPRASHVGRVTTADGTAVAGAEVTFLGAPGVPGGAGDVVRAVADAQGRFRVALLPEPRYCAWAARAKDGAQLVTAAVPRGASATAIVFAGDEKAATTHWRVTGLDRWAVHGPVRVQVLVAGTDALLATHALDADGRMALPPLPELNCEVRFFVGSRLVHTMGVLLRADAELPPPQAVEVLACDQAGKPIAGATIDRVTAIWHEQFGAFPVDTRGQHHEVAVTDADGKAVVLVAHDRSPFLGVDYPALVFVARHAAHGDCLSVLADRRSEGGIARPVAPADAANARLHFPMPPLAADGKRALAVGAVPGSAVRFVGALVYPDGVNSNTQVSEQLLAHADVNGAVHAPLATNGRSVAAAHVRVRWRELAADDPFRRATAWTTLAVPIGEAPAAPFDLATALPLRVQVLDTGRGPAVGASVLCVPRIGSSYLDAEGAVIATTDAAGRVVLPALPGAWFGLVVHGHTMATFRVEVGAALPPVQDVQLEPMPSMAVRVVDANGAPLAGAVFATVGASWSNSSDAEGNLMSKLGAGLTAYVFRMVRSDADGHAMVPFVPGPVLTMRAKAQWHGGESNEWKLTPSEERSDVVVRATR